MTILDLYDITVTQLELAESQVEDLKIQLDDALGAEDMLEQLSERNLTLNDVRHSFICFPNAPSSVELI